MSPRILLRIASALAAASLAGSALAQLPADVLVRGPEVTLTRADWTAEMSRIPADQRTPFATSPTRVQTALNNLLVNRTLGERARARGLDKDPVVQRRLVLEADRVLALLLLEKVDAEAGAEFDRATELNLARARELYAIDRAKYSVPELIDMSHILFETTKRGGDAALAAANDARAKLLAGADFVALAATVSEDPSVAANKGRLGPGPRGRFDPAFEAAAFALKNPGDVSEPVLTRFGYHVIRLESRTPSRQQSFDEVREQILAELRQKYVNEARDATLAAIRTDKRLEVNQQAVDALVVKVDYPGLTDALLKAPAAPAPQ